MGNNLLGRLPLSHCPHEVLTHFVSLAQEGSNKNHNKGSPYSPHAIQIKINKHSCLVDSTCALQHWGPWFVSAENDVAIITQHFLAEIQNFLITDKKNIKGKSPEEGAPQDYIQSNLRNANLRCEKNMKMLVEGENWVVCNPLKKLVQSSSSSLYKFFRKTVNYTFHYKFLWKRLKWRQETTKWV